MDPSWELKNLLGSTSMILKQHFKLYEGPGEAKSENRNCVYVRSGRSTPCIGDGHPTLNRESL